MSTSPGFRPDIQGLRAIAVMLVVLDHAGVRWIDGGYVGADVFFVISGFLITSVLLREITGRADGRFSITQFYLRRARRILPAATLTIAVTITASALLLPHARAAAAWKDAIWAGLFGANIRMSQASQDPLAPFLPPSPFRHFWTLAVEEQFYLVWPTLLLAVLALAATAATGMPRRVPRLEISVVLALVIATSFVYSCILTAQQPASAYFSTGGRAWQLAAGALLATAGSGLARLPTAVRTTGGAVGLLAIIASAHFYTDATPFPGLAAVPPTAGAVMIIAAGTGTPAGSRLGVGWLLSPAPMQWLGKLSYSLYLWHWPVLVLAAGHVEHRLTLAHNLMLVAGSIGIATASYYLVERPLLYSTRIGYGRTAYRVLDTKAAP